MTFIKFNKSELVNLSYSLKRELICANKTGSCCNTSIVTCNTRRYHGLLAVPIDNFGGQKHILLSGLDESLLADGKQFNLGIHRYGNITEPGGHKYIVDFKADPVPEILYKVGRLVISKTILLSPDKDRVMVKYEVKQTPTKVTLSLKPLLAFRHIHSLTMENPEADTSYTEIPNGIAVKMYEGYPTLHLQLNTSKFEFKYAPHWNKNITYSDEARRGFDCKEDLWVPGYFDIEMSEGSFVIMSASVEEESVNMITRNFNSIIRGTKEITDDHEQLLHCADTLIRDRNGKKQITSGFSWLYTGQFRETMCALSGLTLFGRDNPDEFEEILDNLIADEQRRLFYKTTQVEAPLLLATVLQQYIAYMTDKGKVGRHRCRCGEGKSGKMCEKAEKKVWEKYGGTMMKVIESYLPGNREEIILQPNGLLWARKDGVALNWMDAYVDGRPVTERAGMQVETNAFWYNALCFAISMEQKYGKKNSKFPDRWIPIRDKVLKNYMPTFWYEPGKFLADYVDNNGQNTDVRPNQMAAVWVDNSPVGPEVARSVMKVIANELETGRGIRTLSPRNVKYRGVYEGSQRERDLAYHQGCTRPFLLYPYIDINFKMQGGAYLNKAVWLAEGFFEDLNKHGVGAFSELYDGEPPHEPHGAISSALSVAALLGVYYLIEKYKEV